MDILFYAPQRYNNLCLHARSLEIFGIQRADVYDRYGLFMDKYPENTRKRINSMSAGGFFKIEWILVDEPIQTVQNWPGRTWATVAESQGQSLYDFQFESTDLLIMGQESSGLPDELIQACSGGITIPAYGQTVSLNVGVATGIFLYEASKQLRSKH